MTAVYRPFSGLTRRTCRGLWISENVRLKL
jgi:hypothetical protein